MIEDQLEPLEWGRSSLVRWRPKQITTSRATRAPASIPGKNPTATAAPGKGGHKGVLPAGAGVVESMPTGEVVEAAWVVDVDEVVEEEVLPVELVAVSITHCELPSQE